ncbi:MAG: hypothetical protein BGO98_18315 [Myxococcales bacterium 68-20]|nr:hypothetical protein [Myxococcales bacterium]OJY23887.1 MAG: hypothetical protein BGO98_18315 [Myxococcales bacterium 68-20]
MAKISPEAQSVIEVARSDYRLDASHRRRLRERILERAAATEAPRAPGVSRSRSLWLLAGGAIVLSALVVATSERAPAPVAARTSSPPAETPASPTSIAAPNTEATAASNVDLHATAAMALENASDTESRGTAGPSGNRAPAEPRAVSPAQLPDVKPAKVAAAPQRINAVDKTPERAPAATNSMPDEMRILREAHAALKDGALGVARARLNAHASTFPRGILREERLTLSALVYCAEGRRDDARREAEALAREHPHSSHLERLRGSCAAD